MVGASNYIRTSADTGASWTDRATAAGGTIGSGMFVATINSDGDMLAAGFQGYIRSSTDSGATWTDLQSLAGATGSTLIRAGITGPA